MDNAYKMPSTGPSMKKQRGFFDQTYAPQAGYGNVSTYNIPNVDEMMAGIANTPDYKPTGYSTPYKQDAGDMGSYIGQTSQSLGRYGMTDPQKYNQYYQSSFDLGARPIRAQGQEAMRTATQGWGGGRFGQSGAYKELQRKTAMDTGERLSDYGKTISADLNKSKLGEEATARDKEWAARTQAAQDWMKDKYQNAVMSLQGAQFGDQQSQFYASNALNKAKAMFDYGAWLPEFQLKAENQGQNAYNQAMGGFNVINPG